jgi:hypothetical protein
MALYSTTSFYLQSNSPEFPYISWPSDDPNNYISGIDENYPYSGKNDSQGFRTNFKNIKTSLNLHDQNTYNLNINSVNTSTKIMDFNTNVIKKSEIQNSNYGVYDAESDIIQTGDFTVNYKNGSWQNFKISSGTHWISLINLPTNSKTGNLILAISTSSTATSNITFYDDNVQSLGPKKFPIQLTGKNPHLFKIFNDSVDNVVYVKELKDTQEYNTPVTLANVSNTQLPSVSSANTGSLIFLSENKKVGYRYNNSWFSITGIAINNYIPS